MPPPPIPFCWTKIKPQADALSVKECQPQWDWRWQDRCWVGPKKWAPIPFTVLLDWILLVLALVQVPSTLNKYTGQDDGGSRLIRILSSPIIRLYIKSSGIDIGAYSFPCSIHTYQKEWSAWDSFPPYMSGKHHPDKKTRGWGFCIVFWDCGENTRPICHHGSTEKKKEKTLYTAPTKNQQIDIISN